MSHPVYFLSDAHLGGESPAREGPKTRTLVEFFDARVEGETVYLLGDLFDFWFDKHGPHPTRYTPVLRALGRASERGVRLFFMGGNHDYWARTGRGPGWLERVLGIGILDDPQVVEHHGKRLLLAHGDALGGARGAYRWFRALLHHPLPILGFGLLPRGIAFRLADLTSATSRRRHSEELLRRAARLMREEATAILAEGGVDAVIAGHVHWPELLKTDHGVYLNIGDWMFYRTYGVLRDGELAIESHAGRDATGRYSGPAATTSTDEILPPRKR